MHREQALGAEFDEAAQEEPQAGKKVEAAPEALKHLVLQDVVAHWQLCKL